MAYYLVYRFIPRTNRSSSARHFVAGMNRLRGSIGTAGNYWYSALHRQAVHQYCQ